LVPEFFYTWKNNTIINLTLMDIAFLFLLLPGWKPSSGLEYELQG
jgi:hypothetical protein